MAQTGVAGAGLGQGDGQVGERGDSPVRPRRKALGARVAQAAERLVRRIEQSKRLDALGRAMGSMVSRVVRPGPVKDLLSGTWLGHTAHPVLTDLPIGSFTSALMLDLVGGEEAVEAARTLLGVGVVFALPTAATGLSELADLGTEPDRAVGAAHALGNLGALGLFGASYLARKRGRWLAGFALSTAGTAVVSIAGFLGGHLSLRRGIGVDHTAFETPIEEWTGVLDEGELEEGEPKQVSVGGSDILLYRTGGRTLALSDHCTHAAGPLHEGAFEDGQVTCPWHGSRFDLENGSVLRGPATAPQPCYQARVREGRIEIRSRG